MYNRENFHRAKQQWTKAEVLAGVRSVCLNADPPMTKAEYEALRKTDPDHLPSSATVIKYLAPGRSWSFALEAAGCPRRKRGRAGQTNYLLK